MFTSFSGFIGETGGIMILAIAAVIIVARKYLAANPDVKAAGTKAVATKAFGLIGKWL